MPIGTLAVIATLLLSVLAIMVVVIKQYVVCPPAQMLVVYGSKSGSGAPSKIIHGGGVFVIPFFQRYSVLDLRPMEVEANLSKALSLSNIRVDIPSNFTIAISQKPEFSQNAAMRLLDLSEDDIVTQARTIIIGQMRAVIAQMSIESINTDRDAFMGKVESEIQTELSKLGLYIINVNIEDIRDESGYIDALGQKAAAAAIQKAQVDTAIEEKNGAIGTAEALRERESSIALADRDRSVSVSNAKSEQAQGVAKADADRRKKVMDIEADAVKSENEAKALVAQSESLLSVARASADRLSKVSEAEAETAIHIAGKMAETARLRSVELAQVEVDKEKLILEAEAKADASRAIARGEADAILLVKEAEAAGEKALLEARAEGYKALFASVRDENTIISMTALEQMPALLREQAAAVKGLKIDSITILDGQNGGATKGFISELTNTLPQAHATAEALGIKLPGFYGTRDEKSAETVEVTHSSK